MTTPTPMHKPFRERYWIHLADGCRQARVERKVLEKATITGELYSEFERGKIWIRRDDLEEWIAKRKQAAEEAAKRLQQQLQHLRDQGAEPFSMN